MIGMAVRHLIDFKDWKSKEIEELLDIALKIKKNKEKYYDVLKNKTLTMIFQKTSTRTRLSFEAGMTQLGGHAIFLDWKTTQFIMADIQDEAKCVNRYSDVIMARLLRNADLMKIAEVSTVPVINGLCEKYHPCQVLADILTVKENKGNLKGLKLVYYGIANNVSNSLSVIATKLGMNFVLSAPERHAISLDEELLKQVNATGLYSEEKDPLKAVKDADIVYTDTWVDMELFLDPKFEEEKKRRMKTFMPYQVNKELLKGVPDALIMHDLPAHRGYEIDDFAMKSSNSIIFDQAENRLHAQKAILLKLLGKA